MGDADRAPNVLLDEAAIAEQVRRLGREIAGDHPDGVVLVGVLKGALIFLPISPARFADIPVELDFMSISRFAPDRGRVKILHDLASDISGRDVVLVEDIVDTGLTLAYLLGQLRDTGTAPAVDVRDARPAVPAHRPTGSRLLRVRRSMPSTCSGTGCTSGTCTATFRTSPPATETRFVATPDAYVADLYRRGDSSADPGGRVTGDRSEEP